MRIWTEVESDGLVAIEGNEASRVVTVFMMAVDAALVDQRADADARRSSAAGARLTHEEFRRDGSNRCRIYERIVVFFVSRAAGARADPIEQRLALSLALGQLVRGEAFGK